MGSFVSIYHIHIVYKIRSLDCEMANLRISIFFFLSFCKFALSLAKNRVNPIDKAQEHSMRIRANCLIWREYQMRLIQYQGMVHSRNDGTSFNVLGIDGCVTPTFACTPNFSQIESPCTHLGLESAFLLILKCRKTV